MGSACHIAVNHVRSNLILSRREYDVFRSARALSYRGWSSKRRCSMDKVGITLGLITGRLRRRAEGHFAGLTLLREEDANSFGVESAGAWQVRGSGNLALTKQELLFAQWVPNRLLRIPRDSIVEVTTTGSHLGKTSGRELLKIVWSTDIGTQDSIALWVKDLDGWLGALRP